MQRRRRFAAPDRGVAVASTMRTTDGQVPMLHWRSRRAATATPPPTLSSGAFPIDRRPVVAHEFLLFNPLSRDLSISSSLLLLVTYVTM
jgi:hypothetical protein